MAQWLTNPPRNHEVVGLTPGLAQRVKDPAWPRAVVQVGAGRRRGSDPALLWLWCRPAAKAPTRPLTWEPPYARERPKKWQKDNNKIIIIALSVNG